MTIYRLVAVSNPMAGREEECATWYNNTHLKDMVAIPGVISAQRFELLRGAPSKAFKKYLAIYEVEAENEEDAKSIINRLNETDLSVSETLDISSVNLGVYRASSAPQKRV